jgi:hypothetical protein
MKRKKVAKRKSRLIDLHMYGIFDVKKNTIIKISLDPAEIQMEVALSGGLNENLIECEFDVKLAI